ncbi:MAG TPA: glycosyltransferase family 4 protein [Fibrobacteria bacterium]|nr:glycosyltransferase family 4 protein [Fibrobacteria bacterium]
MNLERFTLVTHVVRKGDGQGRVNLELVREAVRQGVKVTIVASEISQQLQESPLVSWHRVPARGLPVSLFREMWFSARSAAILRRHGSGPLVTNGCITSVPADLNACHFVHTSWLASPLHPGRLKRGPLGAYHYAYSWLNARWEVDAYASARTVVSVSEQVRRELMQVGIDGNRIVTIHNGVDSDEFCPRPAERLRFGLPEGVPLALFAGDIRSPRKNLDSVLKAMREEPRLHLAVAGSLPSSPYPRMAAEMGLGDRVKFLGSVGDMPALMASCDVFAFPSRYEACSLVMLEAMAAGLPVITCRNTGGAELVPEDGGFLMDSSEDLVGLVDILHFVCDHMERLPELSARARSRGVSLSWASMANKYMQLLMR